MVNQKRFLLIVGCFITILWFTACTAQNPAANTASPVVPTSTLITLTGTSIPSIPAPDTEALRSIILESFEAQDTISWRYNSTTILANGETHTTLVEYQPPHRYHIVSDSKGGLIIFDEKVYTLQTDQWVLAEIPIESIIDPEATRRLENTISDIVYLGSEYLNEKAMLVCAYKSQQKTGDSETTIEVTLWIGNEDRLPYKMNVKGQSLAIDGQTGEVKGVDSTSTVLYEYDSSIVIESPLEP